MRRLLASILALTPVGVLACGSPGPPSGGAGAGTVVLVEPARASESGEVFSDRTAEAGLDFVHFNGMSGEYYMAEVTGPGGALFDYDGDGDLDLYLVQGEMLGPGKTIADALFPPPAPISGAMSDRLFRNDLEARADGTAFPRFIDVTASSGIPAGGYGMGVAAGDYDGDGRLDLYVTNLGPNRLLHNQGDGTFADVTAEAGVQDERWSVAAAFLDYDGDGRLDLFVGGYVDFPFENPPRCRDFTGGRDYCGPDNFTPEPDRLFRNLGAGRFKEVTAAAGIRGGFGPALGVVATDLTGDGRPDLYVANDQKANNFWVSRASPDGPGGTVFSDEALLAGCAVNAEGKAEASMGVDAGDYDGDGDLDLFMTHLVTETNTLFRNDGHGLFDDQTAPAGLGAPSRIFTSFGTGFFDYDNDGWLDLLVANGAVRKIEALARSRDPFPLHQPNQLFRNLGAGDSIRFAEVTAAAGEAFTRSEVSRGIALGDVDNDGDTDVVLINNRGPARLLLNNVGQDRAWVGLRLVESSGSERDAVGAKAVLFLRDRPPRSGWVRFDGSYGSVRDPRILFGLGEREGEGPRIEGVEVRWPGEEVERFPPPPLGRYTTLRRGSGERAERVESQAR